MASASRSPKKSHRTASRTQNAVRRDGIASAFAASWPSRFATDPAVPRTLEGLLGDPAVKLEAARALEAMEARPRISRVTRGITLKGHSGPVAALAFSPDGKTLVSVGGTPGDAGEVRLWEIPAGREGGTFRGHAEAVTAVAFSPDGSILATASGVPDRKAERWSAGQVRLWDFPGGRERASWQGTGG